MYLTDQQLAYFHTFGFLALPGLFAGDIETVTEWFEDLWARHGGGHGGKAHDGMARSVLAPFIDQDEHLSTLVDDPRIIGIASSLLGEDFNYMGSDGNYYVGDTRWHSDGWRPNGVPHIKIAFYLDPVTAQSGCLRVIPGSCYTQDAYASQLQAVLGKSEEIVGIAGRDVPAFALETRPGDIVLFDWNCKHAAFGGGNRRRMFTINLSQRYPASRIPELRDMVAGAARFWRDRAYGDAMVRTAGPGRMRHLRAAPGERGPPARTRA